ncbi:hypothetical protein ACFWBN_12300 [Streptomyces sp. NPDC059989]|uniref:hypothetical protein n=1 Tax=Streptomyces sp. NPDC059989 TaxID=3347026 RepID=UPI0036C25223
MRTTHRRAAAIAAAALLVPAAFLATPAAAAPGPQPAPAAEASQRSIRLSLVDVPAEFQAGGGWSTFRLVLDNRAGTQDLDQVRRSAILAMDTRLGPKDAVLEYRDGTTWKRWAAHDLRGALSGAVGYQKVPAGSVTTVQLRLRFTASAKVTAGILLAHAGTDAQQTAYAGGTLHRFRVLPAATKS